MTCFRVGDAEHSGFGYTQQLDETLLCTLQAVLVKEPDKRGNAVDQAVFGQFEEKLAQVMLLRYAPSFAVLRFDGEDICR
jgi:hypothetical protein